MQIFMYLSFMIFISLISLNAQPSRFESRGMGGGSEFHSLTISPATPYTLRVSGSESQLFTSTDLGVSWISAHHANIAGDGYAGKVTFTSSPLIQYAISKKDDVHIPVRTTDAGRTWAPIYDPTFGGAYTIHADPAATNRLILSDYTDVYFSSDAGANWSLAFSELTEGADGCHIAGVLFDGTYIMVATQAGIYTSDDDGLTFFRDSFYDVPNGSGIISFNYGASGSLFRLICLTGPMDMLYPGMEADEITSYDDFYVMDVINGVSGDWISRKSSFPQDFSPNLCAMAIDDPSRIFLAGTNTSSEPMIIRSTNGGNSFQSMFKTANNQNITTGWVGSGSSWDWQYANTPLTLSVSQKNSQYVAFGDYATVHVSSDGGENWRQAYTRSADQQSPGMQIPNKKSYMSNGLENTTVHDIMHVDSAVMLAGLDMGGIIRSTDNGKSWSKISLPTTFATCYAIERSETTLYAAVSMTSSLYSVSKISDSIINGAASVLLRSSDNGITWSIAQEFSSSITTLCSDPQNPKRMYAGLAHSTKGGILVNENINEKGIWKNLSNPPRTEGHPHTIIVLKDGTIITSFTARRSGTSLTQSSGVFSSTDGGVSWKDQSIDAMKVWTTSISIDPHDPYRNTWLACTWSNPFDSKDASGGVYRTTDRGNTWTRILTLPQRDDYTGKVNACAISPYQPSHMYVSTATHGLYFSQNAQSPSPTFSELTSTFPARASHDCSFHPFSPWEMFVGTVGNGIRYGMNSIPQIPVLTRVYPDRDTLIRHDKGVKPTMSIIPKFNVVQTINKAQARFSRNPSFVIADTTNILNAKENHLPSNVIGGDEILYMQCRIGNNAGWSSWSEMSKIRFSEQQQGQMPTIVLLQPQTDTVISYPKGEKPNLEIKWQIQSEDSIVKSQTRFSTQNTFSPIADTVDVVVSRSMPLPSFISGKDSVWYLQARALNAFGWSAWTPTRKLTFIVQIANSVDEVSCEPKIYPHPVEEVLYMHHEHMQSFEIHTISGAFIMSGMTNTPLDVSGLPKGIYIIRSSNGESMIRFIKN